MTTTRNNIVGRPLTDIQIVVAVDEVGGFGKDGKIPWHYPEDFKHFKHITKGGVCIMGRRTYTDILSIVTARNPDSQVNEILPERTSIVITSDTNLNTPGATKCKSLREAVQSITSDILPIFVIGGESLFTEALTWASEVHLTIVKGTHGCDVFFPIEELTKNFKIAIGEETDNLTFLTYRRK